MALLSSFRVQLVSEQRLTSWKKTLNKVVHQDSLLKKCVYDAHDPFLNLRLKSNYPFMGFLQRYFWKEFYVLWGHGNLYYFVTLIQTANTNSLHYYKFPWPHHIGTSQRTSVWVCVIHFPYKRNVCEYRFLCILCSCSMEAASMM